jgi:hypothetical protein
MGGHIVDTNPAFFSGHFPFVTCPIQCLAMPTKPDISIHNQPILVTDKPLKARGIFGVTGFSPRLVTDRILPHQAPLGSFLKPSSVRGDVFSFCVTP